MDRNIRSEKRYAQNEAVYDPQAYHSRHQLKFANCEIRHARNPKLGTYVMDPRCTSSRLPYLALSRAASDHDDLEIWRLFPNSKTRINEKAKALVLVQRATKNAYTFRMNVELCA